MSMETWKAEYYPVDASAAGLKKGDAAMRKFATKHSLRKWIGARKENLDKHGLRLRSLTVTEPAPGGDIELPFTASTCALCEVYYNREADGSNARCVRCPLYKISGEPCFGGDGTDRPYDAAHSGDLEPMIKLLSQAAEVDYVGPRKDKDGNYTLAHLEKLFENIGVCDPSGKPLAKSLAKKLAKALETDQHH